MVGQLVGLLDGWSVGWFDGWLVMVCLLVALCSEAPFPNLLNDPNHNSKLKTTDSITLCTCNQVINSQYYCNIVKQMFTMSIQRIFLSNLVQRSITELLIVILLKFENAEMQNNYSNTSINGKHLSMKSLLV